MAYCICWMGIVIFIGIGLCRPFAYNWDKTIADGQCSDLEAAYTSFAALDILGDAMVIGKHASQGPTSPLGPDENL